MTVRPLVCATLLVMCSMPVVSAGYRTSLPDVRAFVTETCPLAKQGPEALGGAIAAALIPSLVGSAVDSVAAMLKAAGEDKATVLNANAQTHFYRSNGEGKLDNAVQLGCLVVVGTAFGPDSAPDVPMDSAFDADAWAGAQVKEMAQEYMTSAPRFYFEAKVITDKQRGAFRLVPLILRFAAPYSKPFFGSLFSYKFSAAISVNFSVPGVATPFASYIFHFPESKLPIELQDRALYGLSSGWLPLFPVDKIVSEEWDKEKTQRKEKDDWEKLSNPKLPFVDTAPILAKIKAYCDGKKAEEDRTRQEAPKPENPVTPPAGTTPPGTNPAAPPAAAKPKETKPSDPLCPTDLEKLAAEIARDRTIATGQYDLAYTASKFKTLPPLPTLAPTNVQVAVTETRTGNKFALYLGNALAGAKEGLVKAAKDQLPDAQKAAQTAAQDAQSDNDAAAVTAEVEVQKAKDGLLKLPADATPELRAQKEGELKAAQIKANKAYRKAGRSEPYPGVMP